MACMVKQWAHLVLGVCASVCVCVCVCVCVKPGIRFCLCARHFSFWRKGPHSGRVTTTMPPISISLRLISTVCTPLTHPFVSFMFMKCTYFIYFFPLKRDTNVPMKHCRSKDPAALRDQCGFSLDPSYDLKHTHAHTYTHNPIYIVFSVVFK